MPRTPDGSPPRYCLHKPTGQAYVRLPGDPKPVYLGRYGSPESFARYADIVVGRSPGGRTVAEVAAAYLVHVDDYYSAHEARQFRISFRELLAGHGATPAADFTRDRLRAVRDAMLAAGVGRRTANRRVVRVLRCFRWAAEEGLVPDAVPVSLRLLSPLRRLPPFDVKPVDWPRVEATLPHLAPLTAAVVTLMWHTGMRPGEPGLIRRADVDTSRDVWWVDLTGRDKMSHKGRVKRVAVGPKGRAAMAPWLEAAARPVSPVFPGRYGEGITARQLSMRLRYACEAAGVVPWQIRQIRHSFATRVRAAFGLDAAQVMLGHASADVTQVYAERDGRRAEDVAAALG